jgi:Flp pilus assembly pilin Flp
VALKRKNFQSGVTSAVLRRGIDFLRDDSGSELVEYALVLALFTLISMATVQVMAVTGNAQVENDSTNYTNAFVNGY